MRRLPRPIKAGQRLDALPIDLLGLSVLLQQCIFLWLSIDITGNALLVNHQLAGPLEHLGGIVVGLYALEPLEKLLVLLGNPVKFAYSCAVIQRRHHLVCLVVECIFGRRLQVPLSSRPKGARTGVSRVECTHVGDLRLLLVRVDT